MSAWTCAICTRLPGSGNARAKLAMDVLLHRALRYVGAYAITLGRVDAIVMTGGIGENDLIFRGRWSNVWVCSASNWRRTRIRSVVRSA